MYSKPALDLAVQTAVAAERERCAKIADDAAAGLRNGGAINAARKIAIEIRASRQPPSK